MVKQLLISDFDGVILDSEYSYSLLSVEFLKTCGINMTLPEYLSRYSGMAHSELYKAIKEHYNQDISVYHNRYLDFMLSYKDHLSLIPNVHKYFNSWSGAKCIASSSVKSTIIDILQINDLSSIFPDEYIFSAADCQNYKPFPDVYIKARETMGFDAQDCIAVEDSAVGVRSAVDAGIDVIGFVGGKHIIDYNLGDKHGQALKDLGAVHIAHSMDELASYLTKIQQQ